MNLELFLGDSYDIMKQSFLRWLSTTGSWSAHPMFTEPVSSEDADCFERILGVPILSRDVFTSKVDRGDYLAPARGCDRHVFLDPDTGIRLQTITRKKATKYLFGSELVEIAKARPSKLTLVFDQSLDRRVEPRQLLENKLLNLNEKGIYGIAYVSHVCFVLVGANRSVVEAAFEILKQKSSLPEKKFLSRFL